jgi:hypothetical protein
VYKIEALASLEEEHVVAGQVQKRVAAAVAAQNAATVALENVVTCESDSDAPGEPKRFTNAGPLVGLLELRVRGH